MKNEPRILIIGMGLMGGSFYKCLSKLGYDIICIDTNDIVVDNVLKHADIEFIDYNSVCNYHFDYAIVTCYPDNVISVFDSLNGKINNDCTVMEMTGLKSSFVSDLEFGEYQFNYVLCHPMAGLEKYGFENSIPTLFEGANFCYITDYINIDDMNLDNVKSLVMSMGFKSFVGCTSEMHDEAITYVSHLPHVFAMIFLNSVLLSETGMNVAATSFADVTRVGNVDTELWKKLLHENQHNICTQLDQIIVECDKMKAIVKDDVKLENYMMEAKKIHEQIYK